MRRILIALFLTVTLECGFTVSGETKENPARDNSSNLPFALMQDPVPGPRPRPIPRPGDDIRPTTGNITGTIKLIDCNASPADVRVTAARASVQPVPLEDNAFVWKFSIPDVAAGSHTVVPILAHDRCRGGAWLPATKSASVIRGASASGIDFEYRGRRDTTRVSAFIVASLIQRVFDGTAFRLNNFTNTPHPVSGRDSWHVPDGSSVTRPTRMGSTTTTFTTDEVSRGPFRYYIQDFNLSRIAVNPEATAFRLTFHFENAGPIEIKGMCSSTTSSVDLSCPAGPDSSAPDFHLDNARVDVMLTPVRDADGGLTYGPADVTFDGDVRGRLVGSLDFVETLVKRSIKSNVEARMRAFIDDPNLRRQIAGDLRPALDRLGVGSVVAVRFEGRQLVMESYPR